MSWRALHTGEVSALGRTCTDDRRGRWLQYLQPRLLCHANTVDVRLHPCVAAATARQSLEAGTLPALSTASLQHAQTQTLSEINQRTDLVLTYGGWYVLDPVGRGRCFVGAPIVCNAAGPLRHAERDGEHGMKWQPSPKFKIIIDLIIFHGKCGIYGVISAKQS